MENKPTYELKKEDEGLYIKELLQRRFQFSSRLIRKLKIQGGVFVNERPVRLNERGRAGDVLRVVYPEETSYFEPEDIPVAVVYEDDDLLVVNKQPGLVVHPTKNYQTGTLANALAHHMAKAGHAYKVRFVNRLDRDTSGLIVIAKNSHCQDFMVHEMESNSVIKRYLAIVHGVIAEENGTIDLPIDKDYDHAARRKVTETGYPSVTHYEVLERFSASLENGAIPGYSLLQIILDTGRTHQIRVHVTHIGHPILGDELYGQLYGYDQNPDWMPRQALHAAELEFKQPTTGKYIKIRADLPDDMENCLRRLRIGNEKHVNR